MNARLHLWLAATALTIPLIASIDVRAGDQAAPARFVPVTDAMLAQPSPTTGSIGGGRSTAGDTARSSKSTRRTCINCSWPGRGGSVPGRVSQRRLSANGVMYIPNPGGGVQALDAANGDLLWEYTLDPPGFAPQTTPMRNMAIYADKVYVATADARLVALNAGTGAVVWDHQVADSKIGYSYSSGPIVVKGRSSPASTDADATRTTCASSPRTMRERHGAMADVDDRAAR